MHKKVKHLKKTHSKKNLLTLLTNCYFCKTDFGKKLLIIEWFDLQRFYALYNTEHPLYLLIFFRKKKKQKNAKCKSCKKKKMYKEQSLHRVILFLFFFNKPNDHPALTNRSKHVFGYPRLNITIYRDRK